MELYEHDSLLNVFEKVDPRSAGNVGAISLHPAVQTRGVWLRWYAWSGRKLAARIARSYAATNILGKVRVSSFLVPTARAQGQKGSSYP
jgi:hypothetical protein